MDDRDFYQIFITGTGMYLNELLTKGLGGVIFFSKDINSEEQFKNLILRIKSKSLFPPFLTIDQEGGRVERTENIYPKRLSAKFAYKKGEDFLRLQTELMANELINLGINTNFAPVADVNTNPENPIIGERAFADNPTDVMNGVRIVSEVLAKKGLIACAKHYPGHGDASMDSHKTLPKIYLSLDEMEKFHIPPFKYAVDLNIPMIMVAHLDCDCFGEAGIPTSLSANAITYLRKKLGFEGVIISDDMNMGGLNHLSPVDASIMAIKAGINILLYRESNQETFDTIEAVKLATKYDNELKLAMEKSVERIKLLKAQYL